MPKRRRGRERRPRTEVESSPEPRHREAGSRDEGRELLARLLAFSREVPLVLISATVDGDRFTDPQRVAATGAEVWTISHEVSDLIRDNLGRDLTVHNGASRIFPPGIEWQENPRLSPLFVAIEPWQREKQQDGVLAALARITAPAVPEPEPAPASGGARTVPTPEAAADLARHLLDPERSHPVVVITSARDAEGPYVDAGRVADELGETVPVHVMATGVISWAFSDVLPPNCEVYGGASRVYPPGVDWAQDPFRVPLRFARDTREGERVGLQLVADALRHVEPTEHRSATLRREVAATGTVVGIVAECALLRLDDGQMAHAWPELVAHDVAPERVFARGQRVRGRFDEASRRLAPERRDASEALAGVAVGDVILVRVASVAEHRCSVEPFPGFAVDLSPEQLVASDQGKDLRSLVTPGEVIPVEVLGCGVAARTWRLSALIDDVEPSPAPSLLPEGPPWLTPASDEPEPIEEPRPVTFREPRRPRVAAPEPDDDVVVQLRIENERLMAQVRTLGEEVTKLKGARERDARKIRSLERSKRQVKNHDGEAERILREDGSRFADPEEQLRFEVYLAWVRRFSDQERKGERRLMDWTIGEGFFESWAEVQGVERAKVVDVIVEVLTDLAPRVSAREVHQLRSGSGGDDPPRTRGRETAWRVSLQVGTPGARRLHYWKGDGVIELSSIRHHDDLRT